MKTALASLIIFVTTAPFAYAQKLPNPLCLGGGTCVESFGSLINNIGIAVIALSVPIAVVTIVWLGFQMLMHAGNPKKIADIRTHLWWVLIGIAVAVGAGALAQAVINFYKNPDAGGSFNISLPSPSSLQGQPIPSSPFQPQSIQSGQPQQQFRDLLNPYVRDSDDVFSGDGFGALDFEDRSDPCESIVCNPDLVADPVLTQPDPPQKEELSFWAKLWVVIKERVENTPPPGSTEPTGGSFGGGYTANFGNKKGERITLPVAPASCFQAYSPRIILLSNTIPNLTTACTSVDQAFKRLGASEYIPLNEKVLVADSLSFSKLLQSGEVEEADSGMGIMLNEGSIVLDGEKGPSANTVVHMMVHQMVDSLITRRLLQQSEVEGLFVQSKAAGALVSQKAATSWYEFIAETATVAVDPKGNYTPVNTPIAKAQFEFVYKWLEDKKIILDSPLD